MLQINGKTFMNLQEAVQWLLDNNALPFQSSANYVANTEIGMGTIVNPSPAKVRIGSLIFFADSKVSTVTGLTENGFIVSDQYNDLVDDVVYVSNVALDASGHLIVTLSNGDNIDAGLIKQVSGFSINGSQHLIVSFNDGTSTDLGAIFNGNITISGNLTVTGNVNADQVKAYVVTEDNTPQSFSIYVYPDGTGYSLSPVYAGMVKTGNKLTVVFAFNIAVSDAGSLPSNINICQFRFTSALGPFLVPTNIGGYDILCRDRTIASNSLSAAPLEINYYMTKQGQSAIPTVLQSLAAAGAQSNETYYIRIEQTFLLSDNLINP